MFRSLVSRLLKKPATPAASAPSPSAPSSANGSDRGGRRPPRPPADRSRGASDNGRAAPLTHPVAPNETQGERSRRRRGGRGRGGASDRNGATLDVESAPRPNRSPQAAPRPDRNDGPALNGRAADSRWRRGAENGAEPQRGRDDGRRSPPSSGERGRPDSRQRGPSDPARDAWSRREPPRDARSRREPSPNGRERDVNGRERTADDGERRPAPRDGVRRTPARGPSPRDRTFGPARVSEPIALALEEMGYASPTPIQELVIEPLLSGADIVGQAQTGTGKTAGFGIPIAEMTDARDRFPQALVLTPTRELARQVAGELAALCKHTGARVANVYGGARVGPQARALESGAQVVVGTPGRVIDLLDRGSLRLNRTRIVVLDEADQMLDIGFLPDVRRILRATPRSRQTALFTATVPTMIRRLIYSYLREPQWFRVGEESEPVEHVTQRYCEVAARDKLAALISLLDEDEQTLVFRRTQGDVDWLVNTLGRRRVRVAAIHGGLPQGERNAVMQQFRDGAIKLLVSTNLTSRGIDVPTVANVINYDIPESVEEYVHRIGRTARMGREGSALTFVSEWDLEFFDAIKAHVGDDLQPVELGLYQTAAKA